MEESRGGGEGDATTACGGGEGGRGGGGEGGRGGGGSAGGALGVVCNRFCSANASSYSEFLTFG